MLRRASIPLPLAGFGHELLQAESERHRIPLEAFIVRAAERYASAVNAKQPSHRVPTFVKEGAPRVGEARVDVEFDPGLWSALERESEAQDVALELLVLHAAIWFAATPER